MDLEDRFASLESENAALKKRIAKLEVKLNDFEEHISIFDRAMLQISDALVTVERMGKQSFSGLHQNVLELKKTFKRSPEKKLPLD